MSVGVRVRLMAVLGLLAVLVVGLPASASAGASDYGYPSTSYAGVGNPPTSDKPQSKLWWNDGSWWADMWTTGGGWHIYQLNRATETWMDTGVANDTRTNTLADTLWDGTHLYIASHIVSVSTLDNVKPSLPDQPAMLYRYSYANGKYTLDTGFPTTITTNSSESMTIDKDSKGQIWATWTQVAAKAGGGFTNTVYINVSAPGGTSWQQPFAVPAANPNPSTDDISSVVAFGADKIGVMWPDQLTGNVNWAVHVDGTSPTANSAWSVTTAASGKGLPDDHLNLKSLQADKAGRVFAVVKTDIDQQNSDRTLPQELLLTYFPATGNFTKATISTIGDCVTRPQVLLDTEHSTVHVFHTAPATTDASCAFSGVAGSIYEKTASMDNPVFATGRGTPIIQDAASPNLNDITTTKQSVDATTGLVVLASNEVTHRYWFADLPLGAAPTAPVASFTATPVTGTAPLATTFTDTSTGTPTSWSWDFGDGTPKVTAQNPQHTYTEPGTYSVTLTATNATGSNTLTKPALITASAASPAPGNNADISVAVSSPFFAGRTPTLQVTLTNNGPTVAGPTTTTMIPLGGDAVALPGGTPSAGTLAVNTPVLTPGQSISFTLNVSEPAGFHLGGLFVYSLSTSGDPNLFNNIAATLHV